MPRKPRVPSFRFHKGSGQAVVVLDGRSIYLGRWNSPQSRDKYQSVLAQWLASPLSSLPAGPSSVSERGQAESPTISASLRVADLMLAFIDHAKLHYRHPDGRPTGELDNFKDALRPLRRMFGAEPASEFGPLRLRAVRQQMIEDGLCRTTINARIQRIRRVFRWGASMELVPGYVVEAINTVASLQSGRSAARESPGVRPVDWKIVDATLPHLPRPVAAMVQIMRYSNCRAEDVVAMRLANISFTADVWEYRPQSHKNQWREEASPTHARIVQLGPRCQAVLKPLLDRAPDSFLFSPREAKAEHQAARARARQTKRTPSELRRRRASKPKRTPIVSVTRAGYSMEPSAPFPRELERSIPS